MRYRPRILTSRLKKLVSHFPVVVVSGARQVGKSTLLKQEFSDWNLVTLDPAVDVGNARADPDLFLDNHRTPLILDEIQYAPELIAAIKRRVDARKTPGQFILTGSQQWSVLRSASESLAGRAVFLDLEGFCLAEIAGATDRPHWLFRYLSHPEQFVAGKHDRLTSVHTVYERIWRGSLPQAADLDVDLLPDFHRAYLRSYIERDVRLLADMSDWQQFGQFTRLAAALTSQEINHSQLGRDVGISPQSAQRWVALLKASFQLHEVAPFHGNTVKRISERHKAYFSDTGLACHLNAISTPTSLAGHPLCGPLFESMMVAEVRKLLATLPSPPNVWHWRTRSGAEVDLLLEQDNRLFPIEFKLTTKPTSASTTGLRALRQTYPNQHIAPGLVVCGVSTTQRLNSKVFDIPEVAIPWDIA
jgi:uncharacterized protein